MKIVAIRTHSIGLDFCAGCHNTTWSTAALFRYGLGVNFIAACEFVINVAAHL